MITIRVRNIKLNVFLNEEEQKLLKEKSNKARLTQSDFIRNLIIEYDNTNLPNVDIENINNVISSTIDDLNKLRDTMYRLRYYQLVEFIDSIIGELYKNYQK
ncbi:MAG: hypothetical protein E7162_04035 [Firmicutes bacterium]|nr:hypothetical protein [Bacillota bacterium]